MSKEMLARLVLSLEDCARPEVDEQRTRVVALDAVLKFLTKGNGVKHKLLGPLLRQYNEMAHAVHDVRARGENASGSAGVGASKEVRACTAVACVNVLINHDPKKNSTIAQKYVRDVFRPIDGLIDMPFLNNRAGKYTRKHKNSDIRERRMKMIKETENLLNQMIGQNSQSAKAIIRTVVRGQSNLIDENVSLTP